MGKNVPWDEKENIRLPLFSTQTEKNGRLESLGRSTLDKSIISLM